MLKSLRLTAWVIMSSIYMLSCSKGGTATPPDPCASKSISLSATTTNSEKCSATGAITAAAGGSTGFTYSINGGAFQASNIFSSLLAGDYNVTVKDIDNCTKTVKFSVDPVAPGLLFTAVKSIITTNCALVACHGGPQAPNFTLDCNIVANATLIKARAVDASPSIMPPSPNAQLTNLQKQAITDWVTAGGLYTN